MLLMLVGVVGFLACYGNLAGMIGCGLFVLLVALAK